MAFNLSEEQLVNTEVELGAVLPHDYRESMKIEYVVLAIKRTLG